MNFISFVNWIDWLIDWPTDTNSANSYSTISSENSIFTSSNPVLVLALDHPENRKKCKRSWFFRMVNSCRVWCQSPAVPVVDIDCSLCNILMRTIFILEVNKGKTEVIFTHLSSSHLQISAIAYTMMTDPKSNTMIGHSVSSCCTISSWSSRFNISTIVWKNNLCGTRENGMQLKEISLTIGLIGGDSIKLTSDWLQRTMRDCWMDSYAIWSGRDEQNWLKWWLQQTKWNNQNTNVFT